MEIIQQCIVKASKFLDRGCGVINEKGIVLAATEESLVQAEDLQAKVLLEGETNFLVSSKNSYVKVETTDQTSLVCFVEGTDQVAFAYANLLAQWVAAETEDFDLSSYQDSLLKNVLLENELPGDIPVKAKEYKIPFVARRVAYVVHTPAHAIKDVLPVLKDFIIHKKDFSVVMDENTLIILKECSGKDIDDLHAFAKEILHRLEDAHFTELSIGVGMPVENLRDCAKTYREAALALTVGGIFEDEGSICRYDRLGLGRLIYQLPATLCQMFLNEVFPENTYESLGEETLLTIERFFENNLNGSETSRQLFVHRNTLVYRLDKVQKVTGLDLRNFDDAVLFKLASMVRRYFETMKNTQRPMSLGIKHKI